MTCKTFSLLGVALALVCFSLTEVAAKIVTQTVEYGQDGTALRGFLAYDDGLKGKRPGVLVVHEWWGLNGFAPERTVKLPGPGYLALAADMYSVGATTRDREKAGKLAGPPGQPLPQVDDKTSKINKLPYRHGEVLGGHLSL